MSTELAFVGDLHGDLRALKALWEILDRRGVPHVVFLGDYINKGPDSAGVLAELVSFEQAGRATLLAGNHEAALLDALARADLSAFLKMGGAATIRSYVGERVGADVFADFTASLPASHAEALQRMPTTFETDDFIAQHIGSPSSAAKFRVSAHVPVGDLPKIEDRSAQLDTGCGPGGGRLTALMWPELDYVQVDDRGKPLTT